jgi:integrase
MTQFYTAGRIGEVAGIQIKNIDLENRTLTIKETCQWDMSRKIYINLNPFPKNKEPRVVYLTDELLEIVNRRLTLRDKKSDFLFQGWCLPVVSSFRKKQRHDVFSSTCL